MAFFKSNFTELPKAAQLRELSGIAVDLEVDDRRARSSILENVQPTFPYQELDPESYEYKYLSTVHRILRDGYAKASRPGQYTLSLDDVQFSIDIKDRYIPALTARFTPVGTACKEMVWFGRGQTDIEELKKNGIAVWDEWVSGASAVFEKLGRTDPLMPSSTLNYMRINNPEAYKAFRTYQHNKGIGRPSDIDIYDFIFEHGDKVGINEDQFDENYRVRLVSGSIGDGGYGGAWAHWKDTRIATNGQVEELKARGYAQKGVCSNGGIVLEREYHQLKDLIQDIKTSPDSRRLILNSWNPARVADCQLPWCHYGFQVITHVNEETGNRELTLKVLLRSSDFLLGGAFNISQYAFLAHAIAHWTNMEATKLVFSAGDCHIYEDQLPMAGELLTRPVTEDVKPSVMFGLDFVNYEDLDYDCFEIINYGPEYTAGVLNIPIAV